MTDHSPDHSAVIAHSPDHAERAREVLAAAFRIVDGIAGEINGIPNEPTGDAADVVAGDIADTLGVEFDQDWPEAAAAAIAAALRGRDRVVEDLTTALHDAISRPAGVVPASAEPFYDWRRYDRGPVRDAKEPRP